MTFKLEADGVHFYCSSPKLIRKLIERGARIVGQSRATNARPVVRPPRGEEGPRPAEAQGPRT